MSKLRVMLSTTTDPWFNLATEEWIFRQMDPTAQTLFFWRNHDTVVIGRNQNPWSECNLRQMESDGVKLARRTSGGGAVFQDLGNSCFTFLSPREGYDRAVNSEIITAALKEFGIVAETSGRNDIVVNMPDGPRKISGSAFRETRDRAFHHGTLLINTDLQRLAGYLTPHPKKLESKGRASVRSRVMNLTELNPELNHEKIAQMIIQKFFDFHGGRAEVEELEHAKLKSELDLSSAYERFSSWDWRFGHAPQFRQTMAEYFSWGFVEVHIDAEGALIERAQVYSDALNPDLIDEVRKALPGKAFSGAGVTLAMSEVAARLPGHESELSDLAEWLKREVEIS